MFRYPVIVKQFGINKGSGGDGCFKGGDGVIRELLFRKKQILSILTERRTLQPYGLKGTINLRVCHTRENFSSGGKMRKFLSPANNSKYGHLGWSITGNGRSV